MENNLQKYKQDLISDLIINGVSSSIELEKRLDTLIYFAIGGEKEPLIKVEDERIGKSYKNIEGLFGFTLGQSYKCIDIDNDDNSMIFIDDEGDANGSIENDSMYFEEVKEPLIKVRSELPPEIDAHGANDLGFICSIAN